MSADEIEVGDHVTTPGGHVHWVVTAIIPDGGLDTNVVLRSGKTDRLRSEWLSRLTLFKKGAR